ncbi:MAG: CoA-transferase [Candidatus Hydrothermales bacterium]
MEIIEEGQVELIQKPDVEEFRKFVREKKRRGLVDKVMDEKEAVKEFVHDGDYIGVELYGTVRAPLSVIREIARQGKKRLRLAGQGLLEIDYLLALDLVEAMDVTYIGYEVLGLSPIFRRAAESGKVKIAEWSNGAMSWRFKAAAMGIPFIPVRSMLGSDTFKYSSAKVAKCPYTGLKLCLLPALILDVGIIHVHKCDKYGNAVIEGISGFAFEMARASKRLIISTEEIVSTDEIRRYPERTIIPYFLTDAVVYAPFGSHPGEMVYLYERDEEHLKMFLEMAQTVEGTRKYMEEYVLSVKNHQEYLEKIGIEKLLKLKYERMER